MDEKRFGRRVWDFLGSRDLSVFIFIMGLTYTLFLAIFGIVVPLPWVSNISRLLPFKILYLLFFINLVICEIKWIPVIVRRCERPKTLEIAEDLERFRHRIQVQGSEFRVRSLEKYLRRRGYKIQGSESDTVSHLTSHVSPLLYAYRGRFSAIGNLLFHIAFLFLLIGVGTSSLFRFEGSARVTEGYPFSGSVDEYSAISASPLSFFPRVSFFLDKLTPRFWEGKLLFTDLKADVSYSEGKGNAWLSSYLKIGGARVTINSIGITPMYVLKSKDGKALDTGFVNLAVFVPGSEDHFRIPDFPHQIFVSFYPDSEVKDGKVINRSMEIRNPAYFLRIFRGRLLVFSGLIRPAEEAQFEGLRLSFPEVRYWGEFRIVRDPGFTFVWISFVLFASGLVWRLLFYRREMVVIREGGSVYLYGSSDYYPRLFEDRLMMLARIAGAK